MADRERNAAALAPGPGLARRWAVALPCLAGGTLVPVAVADGVAVWHNAVARHAALGVVVGDFAPAVGLWSGLPLLAGLVAVLVTRREVTAWPTIGALVAAPSVVAMAVVGVAAAVGDNLLFLLDVPLAGLLGVGGFLLVRLGVRRLVERPGVDTLDSGLDVRVGGHLLLRHDRLVVSGTEKWAVSWYDFRAARVRDGDLEIQATGGRRRSMRADMAADAVAAIGRRATWVKRHPLFAARRDEHRRAHGTRGAEAYKRGRRVPASYAPGTGIGSGGMTVLFMVTMPVAAVVLTIGAATTSTDRAPLVLGVVASVVIGVWAHVRFWRRRAARRYLAAHPDE